MRAITWGENGPGDLRDALRLRDGRVLTAGSGGVVAWDPKTGDVRATWGVENASALALSPDGDRVAVAGEARITIHDLEGAEMARFDRPKGEADGLLWDPDRLRWDALLVVCNTGGLWGLDPSTGEMVETWDARETWLLAAAGGRVLHGAAEEARRFAPGDARGDTVCGGTITGVALLGDGRCAIGVGREARTHEVRTYDAALRETGRHSMPARVSAIHLEEDGSLAAVLEGGHFVPRSGEPVQLPGLARDEAHLDWRFDRDGNHLLVWSTYLGRVELLDLAKGALVGSVGPFGEYTSSQEVAPDRLLVVASQGDGQNSADSASLFEASSGRRLACIAEDALPQTIAADTSRGVIVYAGIDAVELTQASTGERLAALEYPDSEELSVIAVLEEERGVVIELEDRILLVDVDALALVDAT